MAHSLPSNIRESEVYITDELDRRASARKSIRAEKAALQQLSAAMADGSDEVLPRFVDLAMKVTDGVSAGLSIYEASPAPGVFRWRHLRGILARFEGAETPRDFSPCGVTLDRNGPVLCSHPERAYDWISAEGIVIPEVLLVPVYIGGTEPLATLWVVSDRAGHFTREHARLCTELAVLVGVALRIERTEQRLRQTISDQQLLVREMSHRVKNLFAVTTGLLRLSARECASTQELVEKHTGRMTALARAHDLAIRSQPVRPGAQLGLTELVGIILEPHDLSRSGSASRFSLAGPEVACGDHAINSIALVLHELATNALKYGALSVPEGRIAVCWTLRDDEVVLAWTESNGPPIDGKSRQPGFGFTLAERTLRQIGGRTIVDWAPAGLAVCIHLPIHALAS